MRRLGRLVAIWASKARGETTRMKDSSGQVTYINLQNQTSTG